MTNYHNKATSKKIRQLAGLAHERELSAELHKLRNQFEQWQACKIDAFALNEQIHQFHQQTSREIWKLYNLSNDHTLQVARALKFGFLTEEDVGSELLDELGPLLGFFEDE